MKNTEVSFCGTGIIHGFAAYMVCVTLFPPEIKWRYFGNNFVPLFGLSIAILILMLDELKIILLDSTCWIKKRIVQNNK